MNPMENNAPSTVLSWLAALVRAFHPVRWGLCLAALAVSTLVVGGILDLSGWFPLRPEAWWQRPWEELQRLGDALFQEGVGTGLFRSLMLATVLAVLWNPVAAWVARAELLRQRIPAGPGGGAAPVQTTPTRLVLDRIGALGWLFPMIIFIAGFLLLPGLLAGLINRIFPLGIGALLVSVLLPVVIVFSLVVAVILVGTLSWWIMPAAIAAEGADVFDALSRGYSYFSQGVLRFACWSGLATVLAALPLAAFIGLLDRTPNLLGPTETAVVGTLLAGLFFSLFWTLQSLAYLKLRRAIDSTPEHEIWDGRIEAKDKEAKPEPALPSPDAAPAPPEPENAAPAGAEQASPEPETVSESLEPERTEITFHDTLAVPLGAGPSHLLVLLLGVLWTALVLAGGALAAWGLAAPAGRDLTPEGLRQAVGELAEQNPAALTGLAAAVVLLGALGLGRIVKRVARLAAIRAVFGSAPSLGALRSFVQRSRGRGIVSVLLVTAGVQLALAAVFLGFLAAGETTPWDEVVIPAVLAAVLTGLGAFGLGAVAVEDDPTEEYRKGTVANLLGNVVETLTSAVVSVVLGLVRSAEFLGLTWLAWLLTCESLSWWGGEEVQWVRWGLGDTVRPAAEGGLYQAASWVAGFWWALLIGLIAVCPLAFALNWGAVSYLRARQQTEEIRASLLPLSAEERADLESRRGQRKKLAAKLAARKAKS
jgi:hypothetical protein